MYKVNYDSVKNRINIYIKGRLSEEEMSCYVNAVLESIDMARTQFTVCADLIDCDLEFFTDGSKFKAIREHGMKKGVAKVAHALSHEALELHKITPITGVLYAFSDVKDAQKALDTAALDTE